MRISAARSTRMLSSATPALRSRERPSVSSAASATAIEVKSAVAPSGVMMLRDVSKAKGAAKKPSAEAAPEAGGTRISLMPKIRATRAACAGPAPPKATMA